MPHNERLHRANDHNVDQHDPTSRKNLEFFLGGFKKNGIKEEMSLKMYALKDVFRVGKKKNTKAKREGRPPSKKNMVHFAF